MSTNSFVDTRTFNILWHAGVISATCVVLTPLLRAEYTELLDYRPKALSGGGVDEDVEAASNVTIITKDRQAQGPVSAGVAAMFKRIKQARGYRAMHRGATATFVVSALSEILEGTLVHLIGSSNDIPCILSRLVLLPARVFAVRSLVFPPGLRCTKAERRRPWLIYAQPGLLAGIALRASLDILGGLMIADGGVAGLATNWFRSGIVSVGVRPVAAVLTQLVVQSVMRGMILTASVRLMAQGAPFPLTGSEVALSEGEDFQRRPKPYSSLMDAITSIAKEEGWATFFRVAPCMVAFSVVHLGSLFSLALLNGPQAPS